MSTSQGSGKHPRKVAKTKERQTHHAAAVSAPGHSERHSHSAASPASHSSASHSAKPSHSEGHSHRQSHPSSTHSHPSHSKKDTIIEEEEE